MGIPCAGKNKRSINYDNSEFIRKFPIKYPNVNDLMNLLNDFITKPNIQDSNFGSIEQKDSTYNQLRNLEKTELNNYFNKKKDLFPNKIKNYFENNELRHLEDMIKKLIILENAKEIFKKKIKNQIDYINENELSFKINYLTVMLLGKSGVGKSTLINSFLKLSKGNKAKTGTGNFQTINIQPYQSNSLPFLRLIDTRGIELNVKYGANAIKEDAEKFIQEQLSSNNINNFVHCFWYCITGNRFEKSEIDLLKALRGSYGENKIPIIIVYTQATDDNTITEMSRHIKESKIEGEFIKVLAERKKLTDGNYLNSFGLSELLKETLNKCKKALKGEMRTVMADNISKSIRNKLIEHNSHIKKYINEQTILDFIKEYKIKTDDEFIDYILKIYGNNIKYFLNGNIKEKNIILIKNSEFFNYDLKNYIVFYKKETLSTIEKDINEISYKLLDLQSKTEIKQGKNIDIKNRRCHQTFVDSSLLFLNNNFYYLFQTYFINYIFKKEDIICSFFLKELNNVINNLMNESEVKNNISNCFLKKFKEFENSIKKYSPSLKNLDTSFNENDECINELNNRDNQINNDENINSINNRDTNVDYPSIEGNFPAPLTQGANYQ